jgi:hypothetical protein
MCGLEEGGMVNEWLQQVAGDMQSNRKEYNEGCNKFETFFQK